MRVSFVLLGDQNIKGHVQTAISKIEKAFGLEVKEISIKQQGDLRLCGFKSETAAEVIKEFEEWDCTQKFEVFLDFKVNNDE
ncbi:hypothetical protein ACI2I3_10335 [Psychrobacter namhaensis]|uniref:Uncharacterized protein n=1 Tax=Psychrobacter namhaensis TaxID=292734 RepID=A0ABW8LAH0_9GAMM